MKIFITIITLFFIYCAPVFAEKQWLFKNGDITLNQSKPTNHISPMLMAQSDISRRREQIEARLERCEKRADKDYDFCLRGGSACWAAFESCKVDPGCKVSSNGESRCMRQCDIQLDQDKDKCSKNYDKAEERLRRN